MMTQAFGCLYKAGQCKKKINNLTDQCARCNNMMCKNYWKVIALCSLRVIINYYDLVGPIVYMDVLWYRLYYNRLCIIVFDSIEHNNGCIHCIVDRCRPVWFVWFVCEFVWVFCVCVCCSVCVRDQCTCVCVCEYVCSRHVT